MYGGNGKGSRWILGAKTNLRLAASDNGRRLSKRATNDLAYHPHLLSWIEAFGLETFFGYQTRVVLLKQNRWDCLCEGTRSSNCIGFDNLSECFAGQIETFEC